MSQKSDLKREAATSDRWKQYMGPVTPEEYAAEWWFLSRVRKDLAKRWGNDPNLTEADLDSLAEEMTAVLEALPSELERRKAGLAVPCTECGGVIYPEHSWYPADEDDVYCSDCAPPQPGEVSGPCETCGEILDGELKWIPCEECDGRGQKKGEPCPRCKGRGEIFAVEVFCLSCGWRNLIK